MIPALLIVGSGGAAVASMSPVQSRFAESAIVAFATLAPRPAEFVLVDSRGDRHVVSAVTLDKSEAAVDVEAAGLGPAAREACLGIISTVRTIAPSSAELAVPSEDGGMTIEFENTGEGGRELVFAVPDDGSVRYFVARGANGFRKAGVVVDGGGVAHLAEWLAGRTPFSPAGLQVGERSARRR